MPVAPAVQVTGLLNPTIVHSVKRIAVVPFRNAAGAPDSGSTAARLLAADLASLGFDLVSPADLARAMDQQPVQRIHLGDEWARDVARIVEAKAVIIGDVTYWGTRAHTDVDGRAIPYSQVAISWRLLDTATGEALFSAGGHFERPRQDTAGRAARAILRETIVRLAIQAGLLGTGTTGVTWALESKGTAQRALVQDVERGSSASQAGIRPHDIVLACNGLSSDQWHSLWQLFKACEVDSGQTLILNVARGTQRLTFQVPAKARLAAAR